MLTMVLVVLLVVERAMELLAKGLPSSQEPTEVMFETGSVEYSMNDRVPSTIYQVDSSFYDEEGFHLIANGNDPYFELPGFTGGDKSYVMKIDLTVPFDTRLDIFYESKDQSYRSEQRYYKDIEEGRNTVYISMASLNEITGIRIDPGMFPGEYIIHSIEIRYN